ncbi:arylsulfatase B-like [Ixodes scapularis]|uniref:arylsulfatase B-like n=1 Tax=Ixodes scapularis TaxID=6945 RepID=UPI001A9FC031|nr:arylsulfatase B-like [Ixodes scapularis]
MVPQRFSLVNIAAIGVAILLCFALAAMLLASRRSPLRQPHIVFILADDMGWNDVSYNGCPQIRTPNIDALAWNGIRLQRYYTQPLCTPSRAALMTGRYPIHTGMQHLVIIQNEPRGLPLKFKLFPQWLGDLGYVSQMLGKWHLGFYKKEYTPTMRGFQKHIGSWGGFVDYYSHIRITKIGCSHSGHDFRQGLSEAREFDGKYYTELMAEEATRVIENHPLDKPLFLYLAHLAPHGANRHDPLQVPKKYSDKYHDIGHWNRTMYAGMVSALDESVGAVVEALGKRGMLNDTVLVFSSDNGADTNSENANYASSWPFKGQKMTPWEGGVHVPGIIWSPLFSGMRGIDYTHIFHVSDWLPTLYQLAGGNPSDLGDIDGISHLDSLSRQSETPRKELLINIDPIENASAIIEGHFKLVSGVVKGGVLDEWFQVPGNITWDYNRARQECETSLVARVLRNAGHDVACGSGDGSYPTPIKCGKRDPSKPCAPTVAPCLFDLSKDPCEYNNIAEQHNEVLQRLLRKLDGYRETSVPPGNLPSDPQADPALHNNAWSTWGDVST